jgi:methionyl-tRNA formyltransferase
MDKPNPSPAKKNPLRVIFMGTPEFAVPSLRALAKAPEIARLIAVYTQPDRPAGRGQKLTKPPIKLVAEELNLPIFQPENVNDPDEKRKLADMLPDIVVVVAYAQFLNRAILSIPRLGCVNVHSSLLPKFRGAAPIQYAIWKGEKESGVTTMRLVQKMDAGPIYLQKSLPITEDMTSSELHDKLAEMGGELIVETLRQHQQSTAKEIEQDENKATYANLINKEDGLIVWEKGGTEILNQIRALNPWPGTFARSTRGTLKVHKAKFHGNINGAPAEAAPGDPFLKAGGLWVKCANGWIELLIVQPEGKRPMTSAEFLNGVRNSEIAFERTHRR